MFGSSSFGSTMFGSTQSRVVSPSVGRKIILLGDPSNHGGAIVTTNQDGSLKTSGIPVAVSGANHSCPISGHGVTPVTAVTVKSYHNGKLILTQGAISGCGAAILPPDRGVTIE